MTRAILLPLTAILALATGVGLIGVATTLRAAPVVVAPATAMAGATAAASPVGDAAAAGLLAAGVPVELPDGPAIVRVERLVLAPGAALPPVAAAGPTALVVEAGAVEVWVRDEHWVLTGTDHPFVQAGSDETEVVTSLGRGEHLSRRPGTVGTVRNVGLAPAAVVIVAIETLTLQPTPAE